MKKLIVCLLFLICIEYIYPECYSLADGLNAKKDDCLKRTVGTSEGSAAPGHKPDTCCLAESSYKSDGKKVSFSSCGAFEKSKVLDYIDSVEKENKEDSAEAELLKITDPKFSLDCYSSYLKFGLMTLSIILF